jgi:hypothetical protein
MSKRRFLYPVRPFQGSVFSPPGVEVGQGVYVAWVPIITGRVGEVGGEGEVAVEGWKEVVVGVVCGIGRVSVTRITGCSSGSWPGVAVACSVRRESIQAFAPNQAITSKSRNARPLPTR